MVPHDSKIDLSLTLAVILWFSSLIFEFLPYCQAKPGETVLIHGASGAVGNAAVQIARSMGVTVVGTAGTKDGMEVVLRYAEIS